MSDPEAAGSSAEQDASLPVNMQPPSAPSPTLVLTAILGKDSEGECPQASARTLRSSRSTNSLSGSLVGRVITPRQVWAQEQPTSEQAGKDRDEAEAQARMRELAGLLNLAIAQLGPGPYQLIVLALGGGVYAAEGLLLLMLSLLARGLAAEWDISPLLAGAFMTIVFSGLILGTILGGVACDRYGRRIPILATYAGMATFLIAAILAPGFTSFLAAKLMLGFFLGFGVPAANAIVAESCPPAHRSNIYCMTMVLFSCGQMYAAGIVWVASPSLRHEELNWRGLLALSALLPLTLFIFGYVLLLESPHWLLVTWQVGEARAVLRAMVRYKRMDEPEEVNAWAAEELAAQMLSPPAATRGRRSLWGTFEGSGAETGQHGRNASEETPLVGPGPGTRIYQTLMQIMGALCACLEFALERLQALFSPSFRQTTCIMLYVTFAVNFAYYGMIYGLPDTLKRSSADGSGRWSPAAGVFFSAAFEIPGVVVAIVLGLTIGRRKNMSLAFFGCAASLCFTMNALHTGDIMGVEGMASVFSAKLLLATGYIVVYLYLLECYPTKFRATGLAFCIVLGRGGAFCCPVLYELLMHQVGGPQSHVWFFAAIATVMVFASIACFLLPYETKDAELECEAPPGTMQQFRC